MIRTITVTIFVCLLSCTSSAQITVTMEDDSRVMGPTVSKSMWNHIEDTATFQIGSGTGMIYDLTRYTKFVYYDTLTPYRSIPMAFGKYSIATHVYESPPFIPLWRPRLDYYHLNQSGRYYLGLVASDQYHDPLYLLDPPRPDFVFPLTLGTEWSWARDSTHFYFRDFDSSWATDSERLHVKVEASGILRLPQGDFECLRLRRNYTNGLRELEIQYEIITKNNIRAVIRISTADSSNVNPHPNGVSIHEYGIQDDVQVLPGIPQHPVRGWGGRSCSRRSRPVFRIGVEIRRSRGPDGSNRRTCLIER